MAGIMAEMEEAMKELLEVQTGMELVAGNLKPAMKGPRSACVIPQVMGIIP